KRKWVLIDARGEVLGRLASQVASILRGKNKPIYTPHLDTGDEVIIINARDVLVTGKKREQKTYYHHTGYPGGLKSVKFEALFKKKPEKVLIMAIKGMLPHNKLGRAMLKKLRVYAGAEHPHQAQNPQIMKMRV
ncbi:50S ribosomal protein L13, partial [candidate division NPL-UPA2 bacterium]|nr:50S ribosomal protein L13 [candidate division NPL-UPA2 bacterium]